MTGARARGRSSRGRAPSGANSGEEKDGAGDSIKKPVLRWIGAALVAVLAFLATPFSEPAREAVGSIFGSPARSLIDWGLQAVGNDPVSFTGQTVWTGSLTGVDVALTDTAAMPDGAICSGSDWLRRHGAPINSEAYARISTARSQVSLIGARLKIIRGPSKVKAIVSCRGGGGSDGEATVISFTVQKDKGLKRHVVGPGAAKGDTEVFLPMEPGHEYRVAVPVQVDGNVAVQWTAELVFSVDGQEKVYRLGQGVTTGARPGTAVYEADSGRWVRTN